MDSEQLSAPAAQENSAGTTNITINVHPTTGGQFEIEISADETAEELRRKISRRLQTPKERLKVLYKEQVLEARPLKEYNIVDGSKVTLLPSVESGFSSTVQGTQQSIIQAIESLSDPQIDDFLSGRLPLTLALRVGDHMMFVQLQLEQSQVNAQNAESRPSRSHPSVPFNPLGHSGSPCITPRLFTGVPTVPIAAPLGATALLPKPPMDFNNGKKSSPSRSSVSPVIAQPVMAGPSPKVPKLSPKGDVTERSDYIKEGSNTTGIVHKAEHFHHRHHPHSAPSSPEEMPYAFLDPRFDSLQQITHHYNQLASQLNHHAQGGTNHLHRLVTACSSLEQVVAIPPPGVEHLKVPSMPEHTRKSSRKRPSSLLTPNEISTSSSPQRNAYPENVGHALPAVIQNALLRHPHLNGFAQSPAASLLSSAYAEYRASSSRPSTSSRSSQSGSSTPTTATPPAEIRLKHPITSTMLQTSSSSGSRSSGSSGHTSRSERSHHHRRASTSGRLTSGSLSHHSSGISGARVARQMQRLRRLCGSHQQCVAYSNRELATEISSIVHMARHSHHHSRSDGSSHRKSHKACRECHGRDRGSGSSASGISGSTSSDANAQPGQAAGACIDSFTTHGPGIFSGTFSGSLHPSIQDADGRPKRDPKTILQILTDLLNATQQYQGQLGNVGLLPQLFKDHFKADSSAKTNKSSEKAGEASATMNKKDTNVPSASASQNKIGASKQASAVPQAQTKSHPSKPAHHQQPRPIYQHPYLLPPGTVTSQVTHGGQKIPAPAQYMSSVSTIPIGTIPVAYGSRHSSSRSSRRHSPGHDASGKYHRHHSSRCHHHHKHHGAEKACCGSSSCRRQAKAQMLSATYIKREHENSNTRNKMKELKKRMERQRNRRQFRRNNPTKANGKPELDAMDVNTSGAATAPVNEVPATHEGDASQSANMEVQFDDIKKDFEIKEVAHEPPETVTV